MSESAYGTRRVMVSARLARRLVVSGRLVKNLVVSGLVAVALVGSLGACGSKRKPAAAEPPVTVAATPSESASPSPEPSPTPSPTASAKPSPTAAKSKAKAPPPTRKAAPQVPVPPAPARPPGGIDAAKTAVRDALVKAGGTHFWYTSAPSITVPANLMKAVGWQESGWQSTILACDGGLGTMQIMPNTVTWMNNRFGTKWDVNTLEGNTMLGAETLEWLIKYFGDVYYDGNYSLTATVGEGDKKISLLDAVVAAYNVGYGAVDTAEGLVIPNQRYVDNVEALMSNCPCTQY